MKIAIVQVYDEAIRNYAQYSQLINSLYAAKHGYIYISWDHDVVPAQISVYYNKIQALLSVMTCKGEIPDWLLWIDSDAVITNFDINIEDIIDKHPDKEIIFGNDINGSNNGVFLIKNTTTMQTYLQECLNDNRFFHSKFPEQSAMFTIITSEKYKQYIGFEDSQDFNGYMNFYKDFKPVDRYWDNKSFALHLARIPDGTRVNIFTQLLRKQNIFCFTKQNITLQQDKKETK